MITVTQLIAVLFQVIVLIGANPSIPQDVKDNVIAEITQAVGQQTGNATTTEQVQSASVPTLASPQLPAPSTVGMKPLVNSIDYDQHYSDSERGMAVSGQGFTGDIIVGIHGSKIPQDIYVRANDISADGTYFTFDIPGGLPVGKYDLYVYQDNVKVFQNVGDFTIISQQQ